MINCGLTIIALLCGLRYGAIGLAVSYAILVYLITLPALLYAGKPLGIRTKDVLVTAGPQVACSLATAGFGFALRETLFAGLAMPVRLVLLCLLCSIFYLAIMVFGFRITKPLAVAASLVRRGKARG
jgi:PST family polysaccharide transporter